MKIKHLLIGLFAVAAAVACKQEEPVVTPKLDVDKTAIQVAATAGEASFNVTSNQSWVATADADWVSLEPASGQASEKSVAVKVTAEDNETTEARKATVTVKAGELTKTVEVNQAAGTGEEPGPGPELPQSEWALVGSFGDWNPASDLYLSVLDEEYFVYYGFELTATTEFKFLKGGAWPGDNNDAMEIGGNGLVEPNTIQPAGGSNIKVTEAGKYDIYLAADLTKFYIMSEGKLPSEATEPAPVENQWGMMGCFVDNLWSSDVPMTKEGEWIVAKGAQFTELTFKIRANQSWSDATNIGVAPGSERGVVNGKISVVTAEYSKANLGGDAADIKINGEAGTYDVYFSFENLEVYVMEEGFKPGEKEPQNPDPVEITYTVVGTIADNVWANNAAVGLMAAEGDYLVAKNIPFVWNSTCYGGDYNRIEFKIVETGTWDGFAYPEKNVDQYANAEITVQNGGENIAVDAPEGNYDVYFDKANKKVWVMEAGYKPGEKEPVVPAPVEVTYTVTGTIKGTDADKKANYWNPSNEPGLMALEGDYYVAKNVEFDYDYRFSDDGTGEDFVKFKICETGTGNAYGQAEEAINKPNTEIAVLKDGKDIYLNKSGVYDVYFDKTNGKVWVMEAGYKPGEEIARLDGYQWMGEFDDMPILFDLGIAEEGMLSIALPTMDESGFALHMVGFYEIEATDKSSGVISFTQYDWEWDEVGEEFEIQYSELTANSVKVVCENVFGVAEPITLTRVENPYEIQLPGGGDEPEPQGPVANGYYRFLHSGSGLVMAPLAADATSGKAAASAEPMLDENKFLFTYDPDAPGYTIQDVYGRYLGQSAEANFDDDGWAVGDICVATELPSGDDYYFYVWVVDNSSYEDGTVDVYNMSMYCGIGYSAGSWSLTEATYATAELRPTLVPADVLIETPVTGPQAISVADFLNLSVGTTEYQLTGVMEGTYNTTYGNFYLNDGTGKVLVYGLTKTKVSSNDKSFASLGLRDGDTVTLIGTRSVHNGTAQVGGPAYYVSHVAAPYVDFTGSASVDAEVTTYSIDVESNTSWTATASTGVTLDKTSGNGNAAVVMTFAANTASEAVNHTVTFEVEGATKTFTLTQRAVPAAGQTLVFEETFANCTGVMGWSGSVANGNFKADNEGWTVDNAFGADGAAKFGTGSKLGTAETPALNFTGDATLKFRAGAWSGDQTTLKISMTGGTLGQATVTLKNGDWTEYEVTITGATTGAKIKFEGKQASKARFFLDDVQVIQTK